MNRIEEVVYHLLYRNPKLKIAVRNLYQGCYDLLPKKKEFFAGEYSYKEGYYFGFHDVDVFSTDETKVLALEEYFDGRMPKAGEKVGVGYFDFDNGKLGEYHKLDDCYAWNWHKGCRLQWLSDNEIVFNTAKDNKVVSEIIDVTTGEKRCVDYPIDTVLKKERLATTFSYERLQYCMPGYGYPYQDADAMLDEESPANNGLYLFNLDSGKRELLVSLAQLVKEVPEEYKEGYIHYVTHTEFSKDGKYISFLHRWIRKEGSTLKRWTRMMVYNRTTKELTELPTQISGSHYVWNDNNKIIASCIIDGKSCHVLFDMMDVDNYIIVCGNILNQDGHQSFVGNSCFITDTYPDKRRMAKLYFVDSVNSTTELIANTYSPKEFQSFRKEETGHIACDLHPRVSASGNYVCFDCPRTGKRGLYVMSLK